jgi:G:T/U-mismatch repair DNA glycosylase
MKEIEQHPWTWYAPKEATCLIIGTFPSARRNWSYNFFYPNVNNLFWRVIAEISAHKLTHFKGENAVNERKALLNSLKVAITDMGHIVQRSDGSSLDEKLELITPMDIFKILEENPTINKIILTSSSGKVSALRWFKHYLTTKQATIAITTGKKPLHSILNYQDRTVTIAVLYSPSTRAANRISFDGLVQMYKNEIA